MLVLKQGRSYEGDAGGITVTIEQFYQITSNERIAIECTNVLKVISLKKLYLSIDQFDIFFFIKLRT